MAMIRGFVEYISLEAISGWAWNPDDPDYSVALRIYDNGIAIGEVVADGYRRDLEAAKIGNGRHGFSWIVPGGLSPAITHNIEVRHISDSSELIGVKQTIDADPIAAAATAVPLRGNLDSGDRHLLGGWAWDRLKPDRPVTLHIIANGAIIARVMANRYRKDLEGHGIGDGRHGFLVRIPGGLSPLARHVINIRHADGRELPNSPLVIEPSSTFDADLESAVSKAVDALANGGDQGRALGFLAKQTERLLQSRADFEGQRQARIGYREFTLRGQTSVLNISTVPDPGLRALVIDETAPDIARDAGSSAIVSHMRSLKDLGYSVSFVAAQERQFDAVAASELEAEEIAVCGTPYYTSVEDVLKRQRGCFDVIYLHRLSVASKYLALARDYNPRARMVYSIADLHHVRMARQAEIDERPELLALSRRLRLAECTAAFLADAVLTHSAEEAAWLRKSVPDAAVYVVPWDVTAQSVAAPFADRRGLAFIGGYSHTPNVDAARLLVEEVMPLVWARDASIPCLLVGSNMPDIVKALAGPGVEIVGHVAQLSEVFERVRLTVAPLRYGAGIKGKVLESFAAAVPCVVSPIAAEGIPLPPPLDQLVGANAEEMAARIVRLHGDASLWQAAGGRAQRLIAEQYNPAVVAQGLRAAIDGVPQAPSAD
jgi:glycosyltransferase involved in cell wall biosynthesis